MLDTNEMCNVVGGAVIKWTIIGIAGTLIVFLIGFIEGHLSVRKAK